MTAADKLRELLATRPAMPNTEELVRWWRSSGDLLPQVLAPAKELWSLCVECGPNVRTDEDGCCTRCGGNAIGTWLDASQGRRTPAIDSTLDALRAQLQAMTDARDEACGIADTLSSYVPKFPAEGGPTMFDKRIAELRKVGS